MSLFNKKIPSQPTQQTLSGVIFTSVMSLSLVAILLLIGLWSYKEISRFQEETELMREDYVRERKQLVQREVQNAVAYIDFRMKIEEKNLREMLKQRVNRGWDVVANIYRENPHASREELTQLITTALRSMRYDGGRGYYYITSMDGRVVMNPIRPYSEGYSLSALSDTVQAQLLTRQLHEVSATGETFSSYYWQKPNDSTEHKYLKKAYARLFRPLGLVISTGDYVDEMQHEVQTDVANRFSSIFFGDGGSFFVRNRSSILVLGGKNYITTPKRYIPKQATDERGVLLDSLRDYSTVDPKGEFIFFKAPRPKHHEPVSKLGYMYYVPEWDWLVGASVYMDGLDRYLAAKALDLKRKLFRDIALILLLGVGLIILLWWRIRLVSNNVADSLGAFSSFFDRAATDHVKIDEGRLHFAEFLHLSRMANNMLGEREKDKRELTYAYREIQTSEEELRQQSESLQLTNNHLEKVLLDLKDTQAQLVNSEKMASLGLLTAGIAHEINNPINFVSANIQPLREDLSDLQGLVRKVQQLLALQQEQEIRSSMDDIRRYCKQIDLEVVLSEIDSLIQGIEEGGERTKEIVQSLRTFSRMDEGNFKRVDLNEGITSTLAILNNKLKKKDIHLQKQLGVLPELDCLPGKVNQVFMNVLNNAIDAVEEHKGEIAVTTKYHPEQERISVTIRDNGPGIPEEIRSKVFDPFFTTKEVGEGTGLGLSISYGIIEQHQGEIQLHTQVRTPLFPESYTEFVIWLPLRHVEPEV